jgi:hypothetical protein
MPVKKNHFVPQVYLRGFSDPRGKLWVYDPLKDGSLWESDPKSVACENNLYAAELPDGSTDRETLEKAFGLVETKFPALRGKVNRFSAINGEDSHTLITFLAIMRVRNPQFAKEIKGNEETNKAIWRMRLLSDHTLIERTREKTNLM